MYIAIGQGQTTPGDKILMLKETSWHFGHLLQVSKKILRNLILYIFFSWFYTCIYPWGKYRQPPGYKVLMSTQMSYHFIHLLQVSKKKSLKSDLVCTSFRKIPFASLFYMIICFISYMYIKLQGKKSIYHCILAHRVTRMQTGSHTRTHTHAHILCPSFHPSPA